MYCTFTHEGGSTLHVTGASKPICNVQLHHLTHPEPSTGTVRSGDPPEP